MPVTWELRDQLLIITLIGQYGYDAPIKAIADAIGDARFRPGTMLLIDARLTATRRSSEELRERAIWMASLRPKGLAARSAMVITPQPHQFGVARMAASHLELHDMEMEIFTDLEDASQWLLGGVISTAGTSEVGT
jgi:hypothetical protein